MCCSTNDHDRWPNSRSTVVPLARPYYNFRDELTNQGALLFNGQCMVISRSLRPLMMKKLHSSHLGTEGCFCKSFLLVRYESGGQRLYLRLSSSQHVQARTVPCPWFRVGVDLFQLGDKRYLITVDYSSNFSKIDHLTTTTATQVINKLRIHFSRYGIPDQFAFAQQWQFTHMTSSTH